MKKSTKTLRVLSYNIHKGFAAGNRNFLMKEMRHGIRMMNADLVFLQEVVGENQKHQIKHDNWVPQQFEYLADEVWPHFAYGKNAIYSHGHHGNAILSKYPLTDFTNVNISKIPTSHRGILMSKTEQGIHVICLHLGLLGFERRHQIAMLCTSIEKNIPVNAPLIIAGDFNDWDKRAHRVLQKRLHLREAYFTQHHRLAKTFPALLPLFAMDRIYYRCLNVTDAEVLNGSPWNRLSDHCALYAEFALIPSQTE